jgi:hypothetical protein
MVIPAGRYLRAVSDYGSPAYSLSDLAKAPDYARQAADLELGAAYGLKLTPSSSVPPTFCRAAAAEQAAPSGTFLITAPPGAPAGVSLRRFGDAYSIDLGAVPAGAGRTLTIPLDSSPTPWHLQLGPGASLCPLGTT